MPWRFEGCRQRIRRAKAHREALAKSWSEIATAEDFYAVFVEVDDDGTGGIWLKPSYGNALPVIFSLQLGEMLYQLRSALDACVYDAAVADTGKNPPPNEHSLEFPICSSSSEYAKKSAFMIAPLAQKRRDIIESVQPYNIPNLAPENMVFNFNRALGILNDWARKDRHRRLHVVGSWFSNASPKIRCPSGTSLSSMQIVGSGFLENKNQIATFNLRGFRPGMKVQANPHLDIDIAVDEIPPPCADNDTLGNRLLAMLRATYFVVRSVEDSF